MSQSYFKTFYNEVLLNKITLFNILDILHIILLSFIHCIERASTLINHQMAVILELNQPKESETWHERLDCPIPIYICQSLYFQALNILHSLLDNIFVYIYTGTVQDILLFLPMPVWHIVLLTIHRLDKLHSHCLCPESTLKGPAYNTDFFLTSYDLTQSTSRAPLSLVVPSGSLWFCRPLANSEKANKNITKDSFYLKFSANVKERKHIFSQSNQIFSYFLYQS